MTVNSFERTQPIAPSINGPTWVYHALCDHSALLYVGVAADVSKRIKQHRSKKWWRDEVVHVIAYLYPTRREALEVEAYHISMERPAFNIAGQRRMDHRLPHEVPPHESRVFAYFDSHGRKDA